MIEAKPIRRKSLHSETVDHLRELIVSGVLAPGQKIPEKALCERFDISRTPLREALKALAAEGMIELLPQRGARVVTISDEELQELFPIIASIEALAGELACAKISDAQLAQIQQLHEDMLVAYQGKRSLEYSRLNRAIHFAIFEAADNNSLLTLYRNLELRIRNIRHTVRQAPGDWKEAVNDHEKILQALLERDANKLGKIMRKHVMNTARTVRHSIDELQEDAQID
ncbi:GntR family transcriptional regulator [Pseudomonas sp. 5P_3.1_Bac2]|uniref:GntR family transcriptional regulator n=1 Tax=Pseudomonas sp. 5P_3.1_Bac2 TaxID=2971617 RepID=UPI0021C85F51|nr:GntR family transcriptional regulator [Pseudomonas sp. 5P_3.1_Bac2]MCU1718212.1 GntR family transcriptional regulator [Pseudomonas sp. 5P_3.1_Bac2]